MSLVLQADNHNNSLFIFSNTQNYQKTNADCTCVICESNADNATAIATYIQTFVRNGLINSQTLDLEFEYEGGSFVWVSRLGKSQADADWTIDDFASDVAPTGWVTERQPNTNEEIYFQTDLTFLH